MIGLNAAQIRKDFSYFGEFGTRGVGYEVARLVDEISHCLGLDHSWNVVIVGAGLLGTALARYRGFSEQGFRLVAMFDSSATVIGASYGTGRVRSIADLEDFCRERARRHRPGHGAGGRGGRHGRAPGRGRRQGRPQLRARQGARPRRTSSCARSTSRASSCRCRSTWTGSRPDVVDAAAVTAGSERRRGGLRPAAGRPAGPALGASVRRARRRRRRRLRDGRRAHLRGLSASLPPEPRDARRRRAPARRRCSPATSSTRAACGSSPRAATPTRSGCWRASWPPVRTCAASAAPFADDDALWAYTMGGLAALRAGLAAGDRRRPLRALRRRRRPAARRRRARAGARRGAAPGAARRRAPGARAERDGAAGLRVPRRSAGSSAARVAGR